MDIRQISGLYKTMSELPSLKGSSNNNENRSISDSSSVQDDRDSVLLSPEARRLLNKVEKLQEKAETPSAAEESPEVKREVASLQNIERKVIAHENAHIAAGGGLTGGASYSYTTGPDGKQYITGGEVSISAPTGKNPQETIEIMEQVKRAALAPADPSPQDIRVASSAATKILQAKSELAQEQALELYEKQKTAQSETGAQSADAPKYSAGLKLNILV